MEPYEFYHRRCVICGGIIDLENAPRNNIDTRKICDRCKKNIEHNKKLRLG